MLCSEEDIALRIAALVLQAQAAILLACAQSICTAALSFNKSRAIGLSLVVNSHAHIACIVLCADSDIWPPPGSSMYHDNCDPKVLPISFRSSALPDIFKDPFPFKRQGTWTCILGNRTFMK